MPFNQTLTLRSGASAVTFFERQNPSQLFFSNGGKPRVTCARKLRYTGFTKWQLDTHNLQYRSQLENCLTAEIDRQN